jgi:hypothetical protein
MKQKPMKSTYLSITAFGLGILFSLTSLQQMAIDKPSDDPIVDREKSLAALRTMMKVFKHQRCMNCHPTDDKPRQGDDSHVHLFSVQRGVDNKGLPAMRCGACHQKENNISSGVPGAPHWSLAPKTMGWHGLTDEQIASNLVDKLKNGNRSIEALVEHMTRDSLVQWAWKPGIGRSTPSVSQKEFHDAVKTWSENGAIVK